MSNNKKSHYEDMKKLLCADILHSSKKILLEENHTTLLETTRTQIHVLVEDSELPLLSGREIKY